MWRAWWDNIKIVEVSNVNISGSISSGDGHVFTVDLIHLSVVDNIDSSLLTFGLEELIDIVFELGEAVIGVDDGEGGGWAQLSDLFVVLPGGLSVEEVVGVDFVSEWELWNVEVSISVVVVSEPLSELVVENVPSWMVSSGEDWNIEVDESLFKSLDQGEIFFESFFQLEILKLF